MRRSLVLILSLVVLADATIFSRFRRQTYEYPEELRGYAQTYPGTKVQSGAVGRYAPHEWPAWYSRNVMKWDGEYRLSPYEPSDSRYSSWVRNRIISV